MSEIKNSQVTPPGLVTLPDGVTVPAKFWLLMLDPPPGDARQVRPFFDEQEAIEFVQKAHEISLADGLPDIDMWFVLGPYTLRNDV
jgi:hypothetical protein